MDFWNIILAASYFACTAIAAVIATMAGKVPENPFRKPLIAVLWAMAGLNLIQGGLCVYKVVAIPPGICP